MSAARAQNLQIELGDGECAIGLNISPEGKVLFEPGVPAHRVLRDRSIVTFGHQRLFRQEDKNGQASIATQAYMFVMQNPDWYPNVIHRATYDINPIDVFAIALLDPATRKSIFDSTPNHKILLAELELWNTNRYLYYKNNTPSLLSNFINEFPTPFVDKYPDDKIKSAQVYLLDQVSWLQDNLKQISPVLLSSIDDIEYEVINMTPKSLMVEMKKYRHGYDHLLAQNLFMKAPDYARIIVVSKLRNSVQQHVLVCNSNIYNDKLVPYTPVNVGELNRQEKKTGGFPKWKNFKINAVSPKNGTILDDEFIWEHTKIDMG